MDAFEIRMSPIRRPKFAKDLRQAREPVRLLMAPFTANAVVIFEDIPITKSAFRFLIIENPTDAPLCIQVARTTPKPVRNVVLEWTENTIDAGSEVSLQISWAPMEPVGCKEKFTVYDQRGFKKDFSIVFKSIGGRPPVKKAPLRQQNGNNSIFNRSRGLKLKTPSPPTRRINRRSSPIEDLMLKSQQTREKRNNKENSPTWSENNVTTPRTENVRRKMSPLGATTVLDGSAIFDRLQFTPAPKEKTDLEYMASLPTPNADLLPVPVLSARKIIWSPNFDRIAEEIVSQNHLSSGDFLENPIAEARRSLFEDNEIQLGITSTFTKEQIHTVISPLEATFQVPSSIAGFRQEVEKIVTTPLQKKVSESMRNLSSKKCREQEILKLNQGSMPNLHEIEKINSIESNRYFVQRTEHHDSSMLLFQETEIRAQSSCTNIHEMATSNANQTQVFKAPLQMPSQHPFITPGKPKFSLMLMSPPHKSSQDRLPQSIERQIWNNNVAKGSRSNDVYNLVNRTTRMEFKEEDRRVFYDAEMYMQSVMNPDPFAATTTHDPFLSATMYLDEKARDKHVKQFKNWLNALVTVPVEMESEQQKIDVAKIFSEVQNKKETLAQTKETISCRYFNKYRLPQLRKAAVKLYTDPKVTIPLSKLDVLIEKKQISMRDDRKLHQDLVLQRNILELLLCFNSLWLRIGLEVVFGEEIKLTSNADIYGLTNFILNRLFRDRYLESKHSKSYFLSGKYSEQIRKHSLKSILHLLVFLDQAKENKIIKNNPCLFTRMSPYKETREILIKITSHLVANIGDITKYIKRLGIILTHKQSNLDEFDFTFTNLAVDLRDGVRLVKVMEVILLRDDLLKNVRAPAISRLQKIHNVEVALKALSEADYNIFGDILPKDIVEGHREKTLSLLWQIIYKFRAPKFNAAATTIQNWWRVRQIRILLAKRVEAKKLARMHEAATVIQKYYRGFKTREFLPIYLEQRRIAAVVVQTYFRGFFERQRFIQKKSATIIVQRWWRKNRLCHKERQEFVKLKHSAVVLQQHFRARLEMRKARQEFVELKTATILIQTKFKCYLKMKICRDGFLQLKKSAICLQRQFRAKKAMELERVNYQKLRNASLIIQSRFRASKTMQIYRLKFIKMQYSATVIQQYFRGYKLMMQQRREYLQLKSRVVQIQALFRANRKMKETRNEFLKLKKTVNWVRQKYLAKKTGKLERMQFLRIRWAAVTIQRQFRAQVLMKNQRNQYEIRRNQIIAIQRYFRGYKQMVKERSELVRLKWAATILQTRFRALKIMRSTRSEYKLIQKSATQIQIWYRSCKKRDECKSNYLKITSSIKVIQTRWRATMLMRKQVVEFERIKNSVVRIQRQLRATLEMRSTRADYIKIQQAVLVIQTRYRATMVARRVEQQYLAQKTQLIQLQRKWRATMAMKHDRNVYETLKAATIKIQRQWRAELDMRRVKRDYELKKHSAVVIQKHWRSVQVMRETENEFKMTRIKIIVLQSFVKMFITRREFLKQKSAAITIQSHFRQFQLMKHERLEYLKLKQAALVIQNHWRLRKEMVKQKQEYERQRSLIIWVQQKYRAKKSMRMHRTRYIQLQIAAIIVQRQFRAIILGREERALYVRKCELILKLQSQCRGWIARKAYKKLWYETLSPEAIELRMKSKAALKIQAHWRGFISRRKFQTSEAAKIVAKLERLRKIGNRKTVRMYLLGSLNSLRKGGSVMESTMILKKLDFLSRTAPRVLIDSCQMIANYCYQMMAMAIRSEPHKELIELCCKVNLNLARYKETKPMIFMPGHLTTIAQMMLRWSDKDCGIFNTLCTLIWILIQCPENKPIIYEYMTKHDGVFVLKETNRAVIRKERMLTNRTKFGIFREDSGQSSHDLNALPNLECDYGMARLKKQPYIFRSRVTAFNTLIRDVGIDI